MTKRAKHVAVASATALVAVSVGLYAWETSHLPASKIGSEGVLIADHPDRVEAFRLRMKNPFDQSLSQIADYPVAAAGPNLSADSEKQLGAILTDPRAYWSANNNPTVFMPRYAFRIWKGRECLEVIVCLQVDRMIVTRKDAAGQIVTSEEMPIENVRPSIEKVIASDFPGFPDKRDRLQDQ